MPNAQQDSDHLLEILREVFEQKIPFNKVLGLKLKSLDINGACLTFEMRDDLIGNYTHGILHGGVISSVLDVMGGVTAFLGILQKLEGHLIQEKKDRFSKLGTIDLRIDYLRPGRGQSFLVKGSILRTGNKVAVTRMELYNDENVLIAVGTGTYMVG